MTETGRWSDEKVLRALDAHRWIPPTAVRVHAEHYELVVTRESSTLNFAYGLTISGSDIADRVIEGIRSTVLAHGGTGVRIWLADETTPADLADRLIRHGYRVAEETEVLAWELQDANGRFRPPRFEVPQGSEVREARTLEDYRRFRDAMALVFDETRGPETQETAFELDFQRRLRDTGHSDRYVVVRRDETLGMAGMSVEPPICLLFAAGVLPEFRGRGVYGGLVRRRCEDAFGRGAEIALVNARVGTSGPILRRHGFRLAGASRLFEARWTPDVGDPVPRG